MCMFIVPQRHNPNTQRPRAAATRALSSQVCTPYLEASCELCMASWRHTPKMSFVACMCFPLPCFFVVSPAVQKSPEIATTVRWVGEWFHDLRVPREAFAARHTFVGGDGVHSPRTPLNAHTLRQLISSLTTAIISPTLAALSTCSGVKSVPMILSLAPTLGSSDVYLCREAWLCGARWVCGREPNFSTPVGETKWRGVGGVLQIKRMLRI